VEGRRGTSSVVWLKTQTVATLRLGEMVAATENLRKERWVGPRRHRRRRKWTAMLTSGKW
jgi:hypothetical protein